jgi:hypothetical protein
VDGCVQWLRAVCRLCRECGECGERERSEGALGDSAALHPLNAMQWRNGCTGDARRAGGASPWEGMGVTANGVTANGAR